MISNSTCTFQTGAGQGQDRKHMAMAGIMHTPSEVKDGFTVKAL